MGRGKEGRRGAYFVEDMHSINGGPWVGFAAPVIFHIHILK